MAKQKHMKDSEIVAYFEARLSDGISDTDDTLRDERIEVLDYYHGVKPERFSAGSSSYVTRDVFDGVESARGFLVETFTGSDFPISFDSAVGELGFPDPCHPKEYVAHTLFEQNEGFSLIDGVIFDSLTARVGAVYAYWEDRVIIEEKEFAGVTIEQFSIIEDEVDGLELVSMEQSLAPSEPGDDQLWDITALVPIEASYVRIDMIRPEDLLLCNSDEQQKDSPIGHRITKRMSTWMSEGYDEDDLMEAMSESVRDQYEIERDARSGYVDDDIDRDEDTADPLVTLIEAFGELDLKRDGTPQLYRVVISGQRVVQKEVVPYCNIRVCNPLAIPHTARGSQYSTPLLHATNAKTTLFRGIIDHTSRTTNPRYTVTRGTLTSAKELLENKLGGLVNVNRQDGIAPLPIPNMNPFVFQTIGLLDQDRQNSTGISGLTKGIDKDAISHQNSAESLQQMDHSSQQRLRVMAKRIAEGFVKPLARLIYDIARTHDETGKTVKIRGESVQVAPKDWPPLYTVRVDLALSPEDQAEEAGNLTDIYTSISQDPVLGALFPPPKRREMAVQIMKLRKVPNAESLLLEQPPEPPPPSPAEQLEMQARKVAIDLQIAQQKLAEQKAQVEMMKAMAGMTESERRYFLDEWKAKSSAAMDARKQDSKEQQDDREYSLALTGEEVKVIASLNN